MLAYLAVLPVLALHTGPKTIPGLKIKDLVIGKGKVAKNGETVFVDYTGKLTNGTVFDATSKHGGTPFSFTLGAGMVIKGWDLGVAGMKEGGVRVLTIAPALGYGDRAMGDAIPANSTLIFRVKLIKVQQ